MTRDVAPLKQADDAILVDTTSLSFEESVQKYVFTFIDICVVVNPTDTINLHQKKKKKKKKKNRIIDVVKTKQQ